MTDQERHRLLWNWLLDADADRACEVFGIYRVTDFECDADATPARFRIRREVRARLLKAQSEPTLFALSPAS